MAISLKHNFVSTVPNDANSKTVGSLEWNEEHTLTMATGKLLGRTSSGSGAVEEIDISKLTTPAPESYGAVGNGVTNDTAAFTTISSSYSWTQTLPDSEYLTTFSLTTVPVNVVGYGVVELSNTNKLARNYYYINSAPASQGNHDSFGTAFNGDFSKSHMPIGAYLSGATTLGQPTTGFEANEELSPIYIYMRNVDSGYNHATDSDEGRTTWIGQRIRGFHSGQGGMLPISTVTFANGTKAGATSFLASPAAAGVNISSIAGADGVYLNPFEVNCGGGVYDVAAVGGVYNMTRNDATGAIDAFWAGVRIQSLGTEPIDSGFQISNLVNTGIDFTKANFGTGKCAIALKADDKIYFEASSSNDWHKTSNGDTAVYYSTSDEAIMLDVNGANVAKVFNDGVDPSLDVTGDVNVTGEVILPGGSVQTQLDGKWTVLANSGVAASHTGDTLETTLATIAVPAGAMGANGIIRFTSLWTTNTSANNKTLRVKFGGTTVHQVVSVLAATYHQQGFLMNRNSVSSQIATTNAPNATTAGWGTTAAGAVNTATINTASAANLTITVQLANAGDTATLEAYMVELLYRA